MSREDIIECNAKRSSAEAQENGKKGGKSSGAARRRKKAMREAASELLGMRIALGQNEAVSALKTRMRAFGINDDEATFQDAILVAMLMKAAKGDVRASEFLRDTAGSNPALEIRKEELKLKKAELKLKRDALMGGEKEDRDENNLLDAINGVEEVDTSDLPEVK